MVTSGWNTGPHKIVEVKQRQASSEVRWVTALEYQVL